MHCVDCHFVQDVHGNTKLYGEVRAAIEIQCIDCHGTVDQAGRRCRPPARRRTRRSPQGGRDLETLRTPFGKRRFERRGDKLIQNSMVEKDLSWEVVQIDGHDHARPPRTTTRSRPWPRRSASTPTASSMWGDVPGGRRDAVRPRERQHELHRLPLVVEPELLRLPPAAEGEHEDAAAAQRRRRHAQLRLLQLPDAARRRLHARPRRRRHRQPHRPGPLVVRHPRRLVQQQPRVDLRAAADDLGDGLSRHRLQHQRAAHRPRRRQAVNGAARAKPSCAPTATSRRTTTTTPSWPSS